MSLRDMSNLDEKDANHANTASIHVGGVGESGL